MCYAWLMPGEYDHDPPATRLGQNSSHAASVISIPTITWPRFLLGLMAMNVLSGIIVALSLCAIPTLLFVAVGIKHPSLFRFTFYSRFCSPLECRSH